MLRSHRVWLWATGGWLLLGAVGHAVAHFVLFVMERGMAGERAFAMGAMKQAFSTDPLQPSLWRLFLSFSASFALLLLLGGALCVVLAWTNAPRRTVAAIALLGATVWTVAFGWWAFLHPVIQPLVLSAVAVPLHGIVWLTASAPEGSAPD